MTDRPRQDDATTATPPRNTPWAALKRWFAQHDRLGKLIVGVLGSIILLGLGIVARPIWKSLTEPPELYVAVVMSEGVPDFTIPREFLRGFDPNRFDPSISSDDTLRRSFRTKDEHRVKYEVRNDYGEPQRAANIARELANDPNCILVIGYSNSTVTSAAIDELIELDTPIPFLMPIATATPILSQAKEGGISPVLRMLPSNASQATTVANFIYGDDFAGMRPSQDRPLNVAIVGDSENEQYSIDLSRQIASNIRAKGGRVMVEESIGPSRSINQLTSALDGPVPVDVVVYAGVGHHGLLLIDHLDFVDIETPIVMTDGSMVAPLYERLESFDNRVFATFPVAAGPSTPNEAPTFQPVGRDAFSIASALISECADCSRQSMRDLIKSKTGEDIIPGYRFGKEGDNGNSRFRVFEMTGGTSRMLGTTY